MDHGRIDSSCLGSNSLYRITFCAVAGGLFPGGHILSLPILACVSSGPFSYSCVHLDTFFCVSISSRGVFFFGVGWARIFVG